MGGLFSDVQVEMKLVSGVTLQSIRSVLAWVLSFQSLSSRNVHETFGTAVIDGIDNKYAAAFCFTYLLSIVSNNILKANV